MEELHEALKSTHCKLPASEIQALMNNVDMNASGAIDYEEFLAATLHASKVSSDEHLQRAFEEFDKDGSGVSRCARPGPQVSLMCMPDAAQAWLCVTTKRRHGCVQWRESTFA